MPCHAASACTSPIRNVPNEILQEIFMHSLPPRPLYDRHQRRKRMPNSMAALMLLCHICSSWRNHALSSPTLWTHLSYSLTALADVAVVEDFYSSNRVKSLHVTYEFSARDIEFLRWWKGNQGGIAPFLLFDVELEHKPDIALHTPKPRGRDEAFLLDYIMSAQYLDLDAFYWHRLRDNHLAGYPVVFPNLHTVLSEGILHPINPFYELQLLLPAPALPTLRRLSINTKYSLLTHLAALTHLCLRTSVSITFWQTLIRTIPHLQCVYVQIMARDPLFATTDGTPSPPSCTHQTLTTLALVFDGLQNRAIALPLGLVFEGLHLPAVRTLALTAPGARAWEDAQALAELYAILHATPAVTTLALEKTLAFPPDPPPCTLPVLHDAMPIWEHATKLAHIQLALPARLPPGDDAREEALIVFVRQIFSADSVWLGLRDDACPIRAVTVSHDAQLHDISDATMARVHESAGTVPKVAFEITSELAIQVAVDVRREWGSRA